MQGMQPPLNLLKQVYRDASQLGDTPLRHHDRYCGRNSKHEFGNLPSKQERKQRTRKAGSSEEKAIDETSPISECNGHNCQSTETLNRKVTTTRYSPPRAVSRETPCALKGQTQVPVSSKPLYTDS
jgi:hypothetical protein